MEWILLFVGQWVGGIINLLLAFGSALVCMLAIGAFWDRRIHTFDLVLILLCAVSLISLIFFPESIRPLFSTQQSTVKIALVILLFAVCALTLYRRRGENISSEGLIRSSILTDETYGRSLRGTAVAVPLIISISTIAVLLVGLSAPQVMIGDEVTHFYMLLNQSEDLSQPQLYAEIPIATGHSEIRRYPHPFGWHYLGAVVYKITGGSFVFIQIFQALFFAQFLIVAYLLARDRNGVESRSALVYIAVLASLPVVLIFSVAFYQDIPMTAQVLTAFYLLRKGKWLSASLFLALASTFKVTATLFFPSFFLLLLYWQVQKTGWIKGAVALLCAWVIVLTTAWQLGSTISEYGDATYYPVAQIEKVIKKVKRAITKNSPPVIEQSATPVAQALQPSGPKKKRPPVIANHPGDLRIKENYLVFGGVLMWLVFFAGAGGALYCRFTGVSPPARQRPTFWLFFVGISYTIVVAWYLKTAPDARFFFPALPFLLLPFAERSVSLPKPKLLIMCFATLALVQAGYVLEKTYDLFRALTPDTKEAIAFLEDNPPAGHIFMYPEGNYRYFPVQHEWYLGYRLRKFWRGDNDLRLELLQRFNVDAIVVKRHLIARVDQQITNLGVYPVFFVNEIDSDQRFKKVFENEEMLIYQIQQ